MRIVSVRQHGLSDSFCGFFSLWSSEQQNVPEEDSFTSDLCLNSPVKKVEFNLDPELIGGEPELKKPATEEPTDNDNENNNNDTNTGVYKHEA